MQTRWKPPEGWSVLEAGQKRSHPCMICSRQLGRGDIVLIKKIGKRHRFRCVDTDDCHSVRSMGGEPFFRPAYLRFAQRLDAIRATA